MINLDDLDAIRGIDARGMLRLVGELPQQVAAAWQQVGSLALPANYRQLEQIVVAGMGGSAISGDLVAGLVSDSCRAPMVVLRDYNLPAWVNERTLLIASSNSGNTEETLAVAEAAYARDVPLLMLTGGGKLAELGTAWQVPVVRFQYAAPPRAALGYPLTLLLGILFRLGFTPDPAAELEDAMQAMGEVTAESREDVLIADNGAKQMALRLFDRLPVVYGASFLTAVARRWKGQFNENADTLAAYEELPEADHNAVVGTKVATGVLSRSTVLILSSPLFHPRTQVRIELTAELLEKRRLRVEVIEGRGQTRLAHLLSLIHLGDYVSVYLALLNDIDPFEMTPIEFLKQRMAEV